MVEYLLCKCEVLSSNLNHTKKKKGCCKDEVREPMCVFSIMPAMLNIQQMLEKYYSHRLRSSPQGVLI
jgi:hypothetical protein